MLAGVELEIPFADPLRDPVWAHRIGGRVFRGRRGHVAVEHATGGGEYEPAGPMTDCSIEDIDQPRHVHPSVEGRLTDRTAHRHLRRLVADGVWSFGVEGLLHRISIGDVSHVNRHVGREVVAGATREVIEDCGGVACREDCIDDVAADETCAASDQNLHTCLRRERNASPGEQSQVANAGIGMEAGFPRGVAYPQHDSDLRALHVSRSGPRS